MSVEDYVLDNYGECDRGPDCYWNRDHLGVGCLRGAWLGRACPHWKSVGEEQLRAMMDSYARGAD